MRPGNLKAIGMMLVAVGFFSVMDAGLKQMSGFYPGIEVTFLRAAASLPFAIGSIVWSGAWVRLRPVNPLLYLLRGAIGIVMLVTFIYSVSVQALTDCYAIFMSAPLMVAALSRLVLGEAVPTRRWLAIVLGLIGVLIALKPGGAGFISLGGLAAAVSAACYAVNVLLIRVTGRTDSNHALVFWYLIVLTLGAAALAYPGWQPVAVRDWPLIAFIGATGAVGQHLLTSAFRLAPPSTIAPFEYTALIWGLLLDRVLFAILPVPRVVLGGAIVIAGGLYLIWDERRAPAAEPVVVTRG